MENQIDKLTKMLKLWFAKNEIDSDLTFYPIDKWRARDEEYLNDAEMVITTEGQLYSILNFSTDDPIYEEFEELLESFGYYYVLGYRWCLGIYQIEEENKQINSSTYASKLKDERWIKKRELVKQRAEYKCEDCCADNFPLEVHHCYYIYGYEPWEYPTDSLRCLCKSCHDTREPLEKKQRGLLAHLTQSEIKTINNLFTTGLYWFPKKEVFDLIQSIGYETEAMKKSMDILISKLRLTNV